MNKKYFLLTTLISYSAFAQLVTPSGEVQSTTNPTIGNVAVYPTEKLEINRSFRSRNDDNHFTYNGLADIFLKFKDRGTGGRAIVHDTGNILTLNYGEDFDGGTKLGNNFLVKGRSFRSGNDDNHFTYNGLADIFFKFKDRGTGGRAIVHDTGNILTLNYGEDFDGGTKLGHHFLVKGRNASLQGKLEAKEVKVTESPTADFVFEEDYALPTLQDVEKHIKEKKHLPEIASAKEMEKEGVNIGEFQIQLLQKIEELTLYIIELNKEIQQLKNNKHE